MKRIALIHTVKSVLNSFEVQLRETISFDLKIHNIFDDFLASDPAEIGYFSEANENRLLYTLKSSELTGADVIVVTCSTLTPAVTKLRSQLKTPVIAIDDAMAEQAVMAGSNILVLATAISAEGPIQIKLNSEAAHQEKQISLKVRRSDKAFAALKRGDMETHDQLVLELASDAAGYDVVVLAQASMAHLEKAISEKTGLPVFSSPDLCIKRIQALLEQ